MTGRTSPTPYSYPLLPPGIEGTVVCKDPFFLPLGLAVDTMRQIRMENASSSNCVYRECLRNHAASLGSYATDGCGEFTLHDLSSLQCAACGCHRNFHRKVEASTELTEYSGGGGERSKKRFRTKFSAEQKEKMLAFAEKLGWKLQRREADDEIERFCRSVGVSRQVFKAKAKTVESNFHQ
ncbi:hypothetical protein Fmac_005457 [Flemingia macrophylla]|uniref:ZF-HD dimerization-type domain-containing protein n=1 Tax=Flemingia macrophylla TaxID=520843 RepID=A0ABD1N7T5_9FABA